jgi:hypothetical protein
VVRDRHRTGFAREIFDTAGVNDFPVGKIRQLLICHPAKIFEAGRHEPVVKRTRGHHVDQCRRHIVARLKLEIRQRNAPVVSLVPPVFKRALNSADRPTKSLVHQLDGKKLVDGKLDASQPAIRAELCYSEISQAHANSNSKNSGLTVPKRRVVL